MENSRKQNPYHLGLYPFKKFADCARNCADIDTLSRETVALLEATITADSIIVIISDEMGSDNPFFIISNHGYTQENIKVVMRLISQISEEHDVDGRVTIRERADEGRVYVSILTNNDKRFSIVINYPADQAMLSEQDMAYLYIVSDILSLALNNIAISAVDLGDFDKIVAAKQEWEASIDHLSQLICFLDNAGDVVRVNKTIEDWYKGSVKGVKGKTIHDLFHPSCSNEECELAACWDDLWSLSEDTGYESVEIYDYVIDRSLHLTIQRSRLRNGKGTSGSNGAVLIIQDISDSLWDKYLLESYSQDLITQIKDKSRELDRVNKHLMSEKHSHLQVRESLIKTESKLQSLSSQLLNAHEEERKRIAAELHDSIGQSLTVIKLRLQELSPEKDKGEDNSEELLNFKSLLNIVTLTIEEVRRISMGLRPSILDDIGLLATLNWFTREFRETFQSIKLETSFAIDESALTDTQKVVIFRIIQEALNNITKYANADFVYINITAVRQRIDLHIEDNGIGFDHNTQVKKSGFGLSSMRERAKLSGGELAISSEPGKGTIIRGVWSN
ncbi:MAG: histidine kinase [Chromatiales bacterium]|nr:histidine kinase [Chromatiales bacterium]